MKKKYTPVTVKFRHIKRKTIFLALCYFEFHQWEYSADLIERECKWCHCKQRDFHEI